MNVKGGRFLLGSVVALMLAATACGTAKKTAAPPAPEQRIEVARLAGGQWGLPTPFLFKTGAGNGLNSFVYDTLAWKDQAGNFIPLLADKWEPIDNGTAWRITLHPGVKWSDGQAFTADDVKFTFDYMTTGPGKDTGDAFGHAVTASEVVSPDVVVLRTGQPFGGFNEMIMGLVHILPKHIWASVTDPVKFDKIPDAFIGTGPYELVSADPSTGTYLFTARDGYFLGTPKVKRIEFVPAPDQPLALRTNNIDMATFPQGSPDEALAPFQNSRFAITSAQGEAVTSLYFNISRGYPYDNVDFRQALAYGIDRNEMVRRLLFGKGEVGSLGGLSPVNKWTAKDLPTYPFDPTKANALLDKAGLKDVTGDGVRDLPNGQSYNPEILFGSTFNSKAGDMVKEYLRAIGIDARLTVVDATSASAAQKDGRYEMSLLSTGPGVDPIDLARMFSTKGSSVPGSWTVHGYVNPAWDALWVKQNGLVDPTERMKVVRDMEMITANDVAKLDLYVPYRIAAYNVAAGLTWYWVPAGTLDGYGGILNKYILAMGK
jgi:peptide/nickel transport system substrate-binding protein